jgi:putative ABC transport system permease protein
MRPALQLLAERIFPLGIPIAWRQLTSERKRFISAVAGIAFAVTMMLFQLGLYDALFKAVVRPHHAMIADVVLISKNYVSLTDADKFTRRRLYQVVSDEAVESVASIYVSHGAWRNPATMELREIFILGCRPDEHAFNFPSWTNNPGALKTADEVFFDETSFSDYGPVVDRFRSSGLVETELEGTRVRVTGLFEMGRTFAADGNVIAGDTAFFRIAKYFPKEMISVGLIRLKPGEDPTRTAARFQQILPNDVRAVTRQQFFEIDRAYWAKRTPIGFVITASLIVAVIVGAVIMYQILYADVSDHLPEYATLKGIGFSDRFFMNLILQQSVMLSFCGFLPGILLSAGLYRITRSMAHLPTELSASRALITFLLTTGMCAAGGALAARKLSSANPADLF